MNVALGKLLGNRSISRLCKDLLQIPTPYHAHSGVELSLMGHGLSLSDAFWYRSPGSADRWANINFFDNAWDPGAMRAAPIFDYDGAFGFPCDSQTLFTLCGDPTFSMLLCASQFSYLDSSWDWSWYDPPALEGFEDRIVEAYAPL